MKTIEQKSILRSYANRPVSQQLPLQDVEATQKAKEPVESGTVSPTIPDHVADPADDAPAITIPAITILAVQDPPTPDGRPGTIVFAPDLPPAVRREVAENLAWFDRVDRRKTEKRQRG